MNLRLRKRLRKRKIIIQQCLELQEKMSNTISAQKKLLKDKMISLK